MKRMIIAVLAATLALACGCSAGEAGAGVGASGGAAQVDAWVPHEPGEEPGEALQTAVDVILNAYSAKAYTAGEVDDADLQLILRSGAKAPSARNLQPWRFTVVRENSVVSKYVGGAPEGAVLIIISADSAPAEGVNADFDCGLATQNMVIAAQSLGLGAHIYSGPVRNMENDRAALGIPAGYAPVAAVLVGHQAADVDAVASASARNDLADIVNYAG